MKCGPVMSEHNLKIDEIASICDGKKLKWV